MSTPTAIKTYFRLKSELVVFLANYQRLKLYSSRTQVNRYSEYSHGVTRSYFRLTPDCPMRLFDIDFGSVTEHRLITALAHQQP